MDIFQSVQLNWAPVCRCLIWKHGADYLRITTSVLSTSFPWFLVFPLLSRFGRSSVLMFSHSGFNSLQPWLSECSPGNIGARGSVLANNRQKASLPASPLCPVSSSYVRQTSANWLTCLAQGLQGIERVPKWGLGLDPWKEMAWYPLWAICGNFSLPIGRCVLSKYLWVVQGIV